jgi:hypothetical protein
MVTKKSSFLERGVEIDSSQIFEEEGYEEKMDCNENCSASCQD